MCTCKGHSSYLSWFSLPFISFTACSQAWRMKHPHCTKFQRHAHSCHELMAMSLGILQKSHPCHKRTLRINSGPNVQPMFQYPLSQMLMPLSIQDSAQNGFIYADLFRRSRKNLPTYILKWHFLKQTTPPCRSHPSEIISSTPFNKIIITSDVYV